MNTLKKAFVLFMITVLACVSLAGCGSSSKSSVLDQERKANNEITVAIAQDLGESLDPHGSISAGTREVLFNIYEGLFKTGSDGSLIPAVAESYEISEDGLTYTFKIRDGIKFHNGNPVTTDDVLYSISRCAENSGDAALVSAFSAIKDAKAIDEKTVTFSLEQPNLELVYYLTAPIVPKDNDKIDTVPVGTGPFKYASRSAQENFVVERFDDYWGEPAKLSKVTYQIFTDATALVIAINAGTVDLCAHLTSSQTAQLGSDYTILEDTMNLVQAVYLNNSYEPLKNEKVRQALAYAIDRDVIKDMVSDGHGVSVGSSIYPKLEKYFMPELVDKYPYDPEKAKELLAEAGYPDGFDLSIAVVSSYQPHMDTAEVVVELLNSIGINASVQPMDNATWISEVYTNRDFQATITGLDAKNVTARAMLERFVSDNGKNFINYNNPDYDALYQKAQRCTDDSEQTEIYKQMETMLADNAANLYIQDIADMVAIRSDLSGLCFYPIYALDLSTVGYTE